MKLIKILGQPENTLEEKPAMVAITPIIQPSPPAFNRHPSTTLHILFVTCKHIATATPNYCLAQDLYRKKLGNIDNWKL